MAEPGYFTAVDTANLIAGKAVATATSYLDGRIGVAQLKSDAVSLQCELMAVPSDHRANVILDPARLLVVAMMRTAVAQEPARAQRWQAVMGALVELVCHESRELLNRSGAPR